MFTAVKQVPADLTPYGGPKDGYFDNYSIQEVDLETGELLFFWNVLDHVDPADSMLPASSAASSNNIWDCFHVNSVEEGPDNTLLISMRNMWAIYNIDKETGNIIYHDPKLYVASQGNVQKLSNGNQFVGWGQEPYLSEFAYEGNTKKDPSLNFLYDMQFPNQNISYRAFKNKWVGLPLYPPSIAVKLFCKAVIVYASWNGSTETVAWQVLAGPKPNRLLVAVENTHRTGFETKIDVNSDGPYFQVNALNSCGKIIGTSRIAYAQ